MLKLRQTGFTIVELLIVIVVIAILATISIVAYNGIQTRAENTKMIQAIAEFVKITQNYQVLYGTYPVISGGYPCLSDSSTCGKVSGPSTCFGVGTAPINTNYISELKKISSTLPSISLQTIDCAGNTFRGADTATTADGKTSRFRYFLKGNVDCGSIGGANLLNRTYNTDATFCQIDLPALN